MILLRQILFALALFVSVSSSGRTAPLTITSTPSAEVYTKPSDESAYVRQSSKTPYVHEVAPGQRIDILVRGKKNYFQDWVGEAQGLSAPAEIHLDQEAQISWSRTLPIFFSSLAILALGLWAWRRKVQAKVTQAEADIRRSRKRADLARSVTAIPKRMGDYKILEQAGAGAYANVYKAVDSKGQVFALKVPREDSQRDQREWSVLQRLNSPHIVKAHRRVEESDSDSPPFLVLELLEGSTLSERLSKQRPTVQEIHLWIDQLLDGLIVAHSQDVIHRDLKPDNLFLEHRNGRDRVVITDFGIARDETLSRLTLTGEGMGSAAYAPPEQINGKPLDRRADLYAVGVLAFELLTGELPWSFQTAQELFLAKGKGIGSQVQLLDSPHLGQSKGLLVELLQAKPDSRPDNANIVKERWNSIWKSSIS